MDPVGGAELVGHSNVQTEWEINPQNGDWPGHRLRCIFDRLGSSLSTPNNRRPMEEEAKMHVNCLELLTATLAVKSFVKDKSRISILTRIDNTTVAAYINHLGGTKNLWMWCLERNIHITAHEHNCQCGVSDTERQDRLETELDYLPQDQSTMEPTESGPLCYQSVNSVPMLLQLAARSICKGNRCIPPDMDAHEGICQPTLEPGGQNSLDSDTAGQHCTGSPSVEVTTVVPNSATDADRLPQVNNITISQVVSKITHEL